MLFTPTSAPAPATPAAAPAPCASFVAVAVNVPAKRQPASGI